MVSNIDTNVGGLIQYLKQKGLLDNTLLIFMSDNGSANDKKGNAYNAGMKGKKGSLFEGRSSGAMYCILAKRGVVWR